MKIFRSSFTYSAFTMISRIAGFIRDIIFANYLGSGVMADVFYVAFRFPNTFRRIFSEGAFHSAFVPIYSKLLSDRKNEEANEFAGNSLLILLISTVLLVLVIELFMPSILRILAPGFYQDQNKFSMLISSSRIIFPFLVLVSIVSILSSILNSHGKFALSAALPVILNIILSVSVFCAAASNQNYLLWMSWAVIFSGLTQIIFLIFALRRSKIIIKFSKMYLSEPLKRFYRLFIPSFLSSGILQINILIGTIIASFEVGAVSFLYYADRIYQLPLALIGIAIGIVLLPNISKQIKENKKSSTQKTIEKAIIYSMLLALPASVALFVLPDLIIFFLFERGAFDSISTYNTSNALKVFSLGLVAFILVKILTPVFFANENAKLPLKFSIIIVLINTILSILLFLNFGFIGIAAATVISSWLNVLLLYFYLFNKEYFVHSSDFYLPILVILLVSALLGIYLYVIKNVYLSLDFSNFIYDIVFFIVILVSGFVIFFTMISFYKPFNYVNLKKQIFSNE